MVMGRPSKLTPKRLKLAKNYLEKCKKGQEDKATGDTLRICPWIEELAAYELEVDSDTVRNWCDKAEDKVWMQKQPKSKQKLYRDFFGTIKRLSTMQLHYLKVKGVSDKGNAVAIFLMKANHGMKETSRHELTDADGKPLATVPIGVVPLGGDLGQAEDEEAED